ncbi:MAG: DUF3365 domain-containing protein [Myxococcales bacterium]|nr:DUF3365 domain-containing protein [Myxococcales bacterium]
MLRALAILALSATLPLGCKHDTPPPTSGANKSSTATTKPAAAAAAPAVAAAERAFGVLKKALGKRLKEALAQGGPAAAVRVCRDVAQKVTAQVAAAQGIAIGRTSHKLRNAANKPRAWAAPYVARAAAGDKTVRAGAVVQLGGGRVGVLRPIGTVGVCLKCHGDAKTIAPALQKEISAAYPQDHAVGFAAGDLRGFFWAEVPPSAYKK